MAKREPTLEELGLDKGIPSPNQIPVLPPIIHRRVELPPELVQPSLKQLNLSFYFIPLTVTIATLMMFVWAMNRVDSNRSQESFEAPEKHLNPNYPVSYEGAMQLLVDELDNSMNSNVYGDVSCEGRHCTVVLESDFFTKMDAAVQRMAVEGVAKQWKERCYGKTITFKTWDGSIVASL